MLPPTTLLVETSARVSQEARGQSRVRLRTALPRPDEPETYNPRMAKGYGAVVQQATDFLDYRL